MLHHCSTDLLDTTVFANPVNLVGVMGAGIAREVARRWPQCLEPYRAACRDGRLRRGTVLAWQRPGEGLVIHTPTKQHWREPSELALLRASIEALLGEATALAVRTVHVPHLGCGLGTLSWDDVRPMLEAGAARYPTLRICVHPPPRRRPGRYRRHLTREAA